MLANRMVMAVAGSGLLIPVGLIIPFNTVSLPAGWTRFASADDKHIIGAGSTYAVGNTGGAASLAIDVPTDDQGAHTGDSASYVGINQGSDVDLTPYFAAGYNSAGSHHHHMTATYISLYQKLVLGKATAEQSEFPADAIILGKTSSDPLGGLTNVYNTTSRGLMSASSIANGGGLSGQACGSAGVHSHSSLYVGVYYAGDSGFDGSNNSGAHTHSISVFTATEYYKRKWLSAWSKTSAFAGATGMIAMWEGTTAPAGWRLCNGSDGSIDLRDYFVMISTAAAAGNVETWSPYVALAITLASSAWSHTHKRGGWENTYSTSGYHDTYSATHGHSYSGNVNHTPPYYALTFVEKI